jgi:Protein of unknown function (DUF3352)
MKKLLIASTAALALAFAGCGDEDSETSSGPASVIPADMPLYIEATMRPEGEQAENLDAFLAELGELPLVGNVADPGDLLIEQLESQAASAGVDFSYADDVEPWLGEKMGFGISESAEGETRFVLALETTDEEAARDSIESLLSGDSVPYEEGDYEGVSYLSAPDDSYRLGVFEGHVVLAAPEDFEASVDASDGDSLGSSDKLADSFEGLDEGLASFYFDIEQFATVAPEDAEEIEQVQAVFPEIFDGAIAVSAGLSAGNQVYVDYSTPLFEGQPEVGASPLLEAAAGDALGAFAIEDIGSFAPPIADLFERANEAGAELEDFPAEGLDAAFEDQTGVSLDDASAAIGDASVSVRGDLPDGLEVVGEIEATDAEVATALIEAVEKEVDEEGGAKIGPPVGGSDVGFSALDNATGNSVGATGTTECTSVGDVAECIPTGGTHADLPFVNVELDGDVIRYGFFADEEAAAASDPDSGGDFGDTGVFAEGQEAVGEDFEFIGAFDLSPVLDELVGGLSVEDALLGGSPEELIAPFLADKLGVVAFGIRYEDEASIQRYVLQLAE